MYITFDIPDCVLIVFLNFFCHSPFLALFRSIFRFLLLLVRCFLIEYLSSFEPFLDVSSSFCSLYIYINYYWVWQQRPTPVLPNPENGTAKTLTGFGFVGLYYVDLWYGSTSIRWIEAPSKSHLMPLVSAHIFSIEACRELSFEVMDSSINSTLWGVLGAALPMWLEQSRRSSIAVWWFETCWSKG